MRPQNNAQESDEHYKGKVTNKYDIISFMINPIDFIEVKIPII